MATIVLPPGTPIPGDALYEVVNGQVIVEDGQMPGNGVPADILYEVVDGKIVEKPAMGAFEVDVASILFAHLVQCVHAQKLGRIESEMLFLLNVAKGLKRRPDLAFVSYGRWPRKRRVPFADAWNVIPELPIEVVSPSNSAEEIVVKVQEYFDAGCKRVWVIYPKQQQVHVYQSPTQIRVLTCQDDLDGEDILPGFRLPVASLFEATEE